MGSFFCGQRGGGAHRTLSWLLTLHNDKEHPYDKPVTDQDALMPKLLSSFKISPSDYFHHG